MTTTCAECRLAKLQCVTSRTAPSMGCTRCLALRLECRPARLDLSLASSQHESASQPLFPTPLPQSFPLTEPAPYDDVLAQWRSAGEMLEALRPQLLALPLWRLAELRRYATLLEQALLELKAETTAQ